MSLKFALLFALVFFAALVSAEEVTQAPTPAAPSSSQIPGLQLIPIAEVQSALNNLLQMIGLNTIIQQLTNTVGPMMGNGIGALTGGLTSLTGTDGASPIPNANADSN